MKSSSSAPLDCAGLAPQLTALFDGEADDSQAQQARAHLLSCPACSQSWLDWTQHRATLQSEPLVPPPPTLLWRVLIAYRIAAFARPARRRSRLPHVSAAHLRGIEAPLPPRLNEHILARTTRKPSAHVLLTPSVPASVPASATASARPNWKARNSNFRRVSLLAAPALALWILMLGRTEFRATLPAGTPDSTVAIISVPDVVETAAPVASVRAATSVAITPIPVAPIERATDLTRSIAPAEVAFDATIPATPARPVRIESPSERVASRAPIMARTVAPASRPTRARGAEDDLSRALSLAMNFGRRDITRAPSIANVALAPSVRRVAAPVVALPAETPRAQSASAPKTASSPVAPVRTVRATTATRRTVVAANVATSRVNLLGLTAPISSVRTLTAARVRPAAFSEETSRPLTTSLSANGRRIARALPDASDTPLRFSRPQAGAPTLREVTFRPDNNGPRIDELRSAVDDFRASISGDRFGDE